jgi:hypothetical protein
MPHAWPCAPAPSLVALAGGEPDEQEPTKNSMVARNRKRRNVPPRQRRRGVRQQGTVRHGTRSGLNPRSSSFSSLLLQPRRWLVCWLLLQTESVEWGTGSDQLMELLGLPYQEFSIIPNKSKPIREWQLFSFTLLVKVEVWQNHLKNKEFIFQHSDRVILNEAIMQQTHIWSI